LENVLGVTDVKVIRGHNHLAVVDSSLAEAV
jgi:Icc protein